MSGLPKLAAEGFTLLLAARLWGAEATAPDFVSRLAPVRVLFRTNEKPDNRSGFFTHGTENAAPT